MKIFSLLRLFLFFIVPINLCGQDYKTYAQNKLFPFLPHNPHWKNLIEKSIDHCKPMQTEGVNQAQQLLDAKVCIKVYAALFRQQVFIQKGSVGVFQSVGAHNFIVTTLKHALVSYSPASLCTDESTFMKGQTKMRQVLQEAFAQTTGLESHLTFKKILEND